MDSRREERDRMVATQLASRGIASPAVLNAMASVPRHRFVPVDCEHLAYEDRPLPIGLGQTISQPYMVACMTELLALAPADRVLEIGTGSGYQTAVLAELCAEVVTVERHPELQERAKVQLGRLGYDNIHYVTGDGTLGWPREAPYDAVLVTAGSPRIPSALLEQLGDGGRLVCPVGERTRQRLELVTRQGNTLIPEVYTECIFVPLMGQDGWPPDGDCARFPAGT